MTITHAGQEHIGYAGVMSITQSGKEHIAH